ncbi:MAG: PAS domain S-box protein [Betaproteobacteria bacterium]
MQEGAHRLPAGTLSMPAPDNNGEEGTKRCLEDVIALSMLHGVWTGAEPLRIAESLAASLCTMLEPEFVYVAITDGRPVAVAQTERHQTSAGLAERWGPAILDWSRTHDPEDHMLLESSWGAVRVAARALGTHGEFGVIAAAFLDASPTPAQNIVLNVAASQGATAIQNVRLLHSLRDSERHVREANAALTERVTELQQAQAELRKARTAALNIMDDAVQSHQREQALNTELNAEIAERRLAERNLSESLARESAARGEAETLNKLARTLVAELDLETLVQQITDAGAELTGAKFGAFFYNVINEQGEALLLYTLSGAPREAFAKFGLPRNTPIFEPTFRGTGVVRFDDVPGDPRYGTMPPHHGMPKGHLPVRSYLAVPVVSRSGKVLGGLFFGHPELGVFKERHERLIVGLAAQAAVAMDNARLYGEAQREIAQRRQAEEALRESQSQLESELTDSRLLQGISAEMAHQGDIESLYDKILDAAVAIMRSDYASMQMLHPERGSGGELRLLACRGFSPQAAKFWEWVRADSESTCGVALRTGKRVIAPDVERCDFMAGTQDQATYLQTGIHAVQTTPLLSRSGKLVGMISTHWREPHEPSERDLRLLDILSRQAADLIERKQAEEARAHLAAIVEWSDDAIISKDLQGIIKSWNKGAERTFGYTAAEAIGKSVMMLIPSGRADEEPEILGRIRRGDIVNHCETVRRRKDGTELYVSLTVSPLRDEAGNIVGASKISRDITERTIAEEQLSQSRKALAQLVERAPFGIYIVDSQFRISSMNVGSRTGAFHNVQPVIGRDFAEAMRILWPEPVAAEIIGHFRHTLDTGEAYYSKDFINPRSDIETVEAYEWELHRITLADGQYGVVCYYYDSTKLRRAEQVIRESELRYRSLVSVITDVPWITDAKGRFVAPQPAWAAYTGQSWDELRDFGWANALHPDDRERVRAIWQRACEAGSLYEAQGRLWHAPTQTYRYFEVRATPLLDADGIVREWIGSCTDVHDHRVAEAALRESEAYFRETTQNMPSVVWTNMPDGKVDFVNDQWLALTGQTLDYVQSDPGAWMVALHPEDRERAGNIYQEGTRSKAGFTMEARFRRAADGEYRWHINRSVPLRDAAGNVVKFIGTCTDVHEQRMAEEALKEADRRKDEFLAQLAHELRNPLAPVRNAVELLRRKGSNEPEVRWSQDVIERQVGHLTRLIDDLLDVSRITRNRLELRKQRLDLSEVVQAAVETSRPIIEQCGHEFTVTLPPEPVYLYGDLVRLAQVFMNLLVNAAKYTERGGRIGLSAGRAAGGSEIVVKVKDTGVGIPKDKLPRLFEMFFQVDRALERSQGGLGIGLSLVRSLVDLHGGSVSAHSEGPGKGSEFIVRLPVVMETQESAAAPKPAAGADTNGASRRRILVVDDNRDAADSLAMLLRLTGEDTHTAHDSLDALSAMEKFRPHVALLDIGMPNLNGYDLCRRIREQPWGKDVALIAVTGWGQEEDRRRTKEAGFDAHMVKPVDYAALAKLLASLSESKNRADTTVSELPTP